ncbi:hypothetical protein [Faecalibaculum rodentium]|uniref:hypothetical protein n=1 Tax=Faecalibaculum rodentium TaxID=1702221 RepID=UPI003F662225
MTRHGRVNYAKYRTAGGSYGTGCGQTIVNLYDGDGDVRPSCYTCSNCAEKHCMINGLPIPQLGKNTYRDCRFFNRLFSEVDAELIQQSEPVSRKTARPAELKKLLSQFREGNPVYHRTFGHGKIERLDHDRAMIRFKRRGVKIINLKSSLEHGQILAL